MRDIINLENENADTWLNITSIISSTKRYGEKIIKGVKKNGDSIFDQHRVQADISNMNNPYLQGLADDVHEVADMLLDQRTNIITKTLIKEEGAGDQCIHTDKEKYMKSLSIFLPITDNYKVEVYKRNGTNKEGQILLQKYTVTLNRGDLAVISSHCLHNGTKAYEDSAIIFLRGYRRRQ